MGMLFYGGAIQASDNPAESGTVHGTLIDTIKDLGYIVFSEHCRGKSMQEARDIFERQFGPVPKGMFRKAWTRQTIIKFLNSQDLSGAVFELSISSTGTGMELECVLERGKKGLFDVPVLGLYRLGSCKYELSTMASGILPEEHPLFSARIYDRIEVAQQYIRDFLRNIPI